MNKTIFSAALLSLAVATPVMAKDAPVKFSHEGVDYTYTVTNVGDDTRIIEGFTTPGDRFRLVVSGNRVVGTSNGVPVSFRVSSATGMSKGKTTPAVTVASR